MDALINLLIDKIRLVPGNQQLCFLVLNKSYNTYFIIMKNSSGEYEISYG